MAQTDYLLPKEGSTLLLDLRSVQEMLLDSECEAQGARARLELDASLCRSMRAELDAKRKECDQLRHMVDQNHDLVQQQVESEKRLLKAEAELAAVRSQLQAQGCALALSQGNVTELQALQDSLQEQLSVTRQSWAAQVQQLQQEYGRQRAEMQQQISSSIQSRQQEVRELHQSCESLLAAEGQHMSQGEGGHEEAALSAALREKATVEERLAKEMAAWQATLASMQQGRNDEAWKGRMQRMRAELEAAKAERDGLRQMMQGMQVAGRGPPQQQQQQQAVQYAQLPQQMVPPAYGQPQSLGQGRGAGPIRGPMPALRTSTFGAK